MEDFIELRYGQRGNPISVQRIQEMVGPGWKRIISSLIEDLHLLGWDGKVLQVKEKFGGLRFYVELETLEIQERILEAGRRSMITCEECGEPGELQNTGWIKCLCADCVKKRK